MDYDSVFFFLLILAVTVSSSIILYSIFFSGVPFELLNSDINIAGPMDKTLVVIGEVIELFYVAMVFYLRKAIIKMISGDLFHDDVAKNLNIAGAILLSISLGSILLKFAKDLSDGILNIGFESPLFNNKLFMVIIGLFLMLMSRVIKEGLTLKGENDLTI